MNTEISKSHSQRFNWSRSGLCLIIFVCLIALPGFVFAQQNTSSQEKKNATIEQSNLSNDAKAKAGTTQEPDVEENPPEKKTETASGVVFVDVDENGMFNEGDIVQPGVHVSNGKDIVTTDSKGRYLIEVDDDSIVFVIKPRGRRTALDKQNLPKFYYTHKPKGSPKSRFPGVEPTGNLPASIDFPLYKQDEPEKFEAIIFADPQARNIKELDYIAHDVIEELVGTKAAFGVTLGDILFDDLSLFDAHNQNVAMVGIPWHNVIGNHDLNLDARERKYVNETFEKYFGPTYYSFEYGQVHFVVLDNIDWVVPGEGEKGNPKYEAAFGEQQLEWLKKDLELIDDDKMVVLLMHIPLHGTRDAKELYKLIDKRPLCISMSGHTHYHAHKFLKKEDGWNGVEPHHHIVNVTVSGSWWAGQKDERGIPHALMSDGAPNGYSILGFDGDKYQLDFKAASKDSGYQMEIYVQDEIDQAELVKSQLVVNVFNGSEKTKVAMRIDNRGDWTQLEKKNGVDPNFKKLFERELRVQPVISPALPRPGNSTHLWHGKLPEELSVGHHLITIQATDRNGRTFTSNQIVRVVAAKPANNAADTKTDQGK